MTMRKLWATLAVVSLAGAVAAPARADDKNGQNQDQNQNQKQKHSGNWTIHGKVAGVTAEGELALDYQTNRAVMVETAYLTIVGSPAGHDASHHEASHHEASHHDRDNIYVVALTPKTKVCQAGGDSGKSDQKKEVALDQLEVGDRVEVAFQSDDESNAAGGNRPTARMRGKHGRHRIFFGSAKDITILPSKKDHDSSKDDHDNNNKDKNDSGDSSSKSS
jgi:hypothetical protein